MSDEQNNATATEVKVTLGGPVDTAQVLGVTVDMDLNQPDMCLLSLRNEEHKYSNSVKPADALEVKIGDEIVFKGEVVGLEPFYRTDGESKVVVRAFNKLHRLLRGRKSRTFLDKSDQDIAGIIAQDAGLSAKSGSSPKITHVHVYQHNQTNLEFLRLRAARLGFEVWVDGSDLYFDKPKSDRDSGIKLVMGSDESDASAVAMTSFTPRLTTSALVNKVVVRGWNPDKKEEIVGEASVPGSSKLGSEIGAAAAKSGFGNVETFEVDHPIFSVDEAKAIAESVLGERLMGYITGDGMCQGKPQIKPGIVVKITVNSDDENDRFNGKYMVIGATHTYASDRGGGGGTAGFKTTFRVARDAASKGAEGGEQDSEQLE